MLIRSMPVQAELDAARAEGGQEIMVQLESGGVLKVHPGQEVATDQATGTRYSVTWAQDDRGAISVCLPPLPMRHAHVLARRSSTPSCSSFKPSDMRTGS